MWTGLDSQGQIGKLEGTSEATGRALVYPKERLWLGLGYMGQLKNLWWKVVSGGK